MEILNNNNTTQLIKFMKPGLLFDFYINTIFNNFKPRKS